MGPSFSRKYNTLLVAATAIYLPIIKRSSIDFAVSADWTPATGDVKVSLDGAAAANITNLPTAITMGNTAMWQFILTAAELSCKQCVITVADSATKAVEDQMFGVETYGHASAFYAADLAAANLPANVIQVNSTAQTAGDLAALLATIAAYIDTEVAAIKAKTDNLPVDPADASDIVAAFSSLTTLLSSTGIALTSAERTALAGVLLTTAGSESYRADGAVPTLIQAMCEILAHLGEASISGTTKTIKRFDGSTAAATFTLNDASTPTSITRAT